MDGFTPEDDEKLIQLVSRFPVLYDTKHIDFKDQHFKDQIWKDIAKELNKSGESCCQRHWRNIRDGYARFKRCKSASTDGPKNPRSKWQFYKLLSFLDAVTPEKSGTSIGEEISKNNDTDSQNNSIQPEFVSTDSPDLNKTATDAMENIPEASTSHPNQPQKRRCVAERDSLNTLIDYFKQIDEKRQSSLIRKAQKNDTDFDMETFAAYIKQVLKKLPPVLKIKAKKEIYDVLYKYEMLTVRQAETPRDHLANGSGNPNFNPFILPAEFFSEADEEEKEVMEVNGI